MCVCVCVCVCVCFWSDTIITSDNTNIKCESRKCEFAWPAYSPDLNPLDFFLWGHLILKTLVYWDPTPKTVGEPKEKIRSEIKKLNRNKEMFSAVYDNFLVRVQRLYSTKGDYMEHILNY